MVAPDRAEGVQRLKKLVVTDNQYREDVLTYLHATLGIQSVSALANYWVTDAYETKVTGDVISTLADQARQQLRHMRWCRSCFFALPVSLRKKIKPVVLQ